VTSMSNWTAKKLLARLSELSNPKTRAHNIKYGAGENQFGVPLGEIRKLADEIKSNHALGLQLWQSGNADAQLLGILLMKPRQLTPQDVDRMVREVAFSQVADWFNSYIVKKHPAKEALRQAWMQDEDRWAARAGWNVTAERLYKSPEGLDVRALLDRIAAELSAAPPEAQWTMNFCLAGIGINFPEHRARAIAIGESVGLYRDYPVSKGCVSPFAPSWIEEMVRRQK